MNDIQNIPNILQRLADTGSTNDKKTILEETKSNTLSAIFKQAYDPFITFGTVKIDTSDIVYNENKKIDKQWFDKLFALLKKLENRELTGNIARNTVKDFIKDSPEQWGKLVLKILKKDLRIGAGKRIINKVYNKLFLEEICMSAMKYDKKRVTFPVYADIKLDGIRCIAKLGDKLKDDKTQLVSRNGKEFKNYPFIAKELEQLDILKYHLLDGEIVMDHFQSLMRTVSRKDGGIELAKDAVYNIFDIHLTKSTFRQRLDILEEVEKEINKKNLKHLKIIKGTEITNEDSLIDFYNNQLADGHEGIMVKKLDGLYEYKRSYSWMKMKPSETLDVKIVDIKEGTGKYKNNFGAFTCELSNNLLVNVGTGFSDEDRKQYWKNKKELIGQTIEIKYQEQTNDGNLRFPVFIRLRPDK